MTILHLSSAALGTVIAVLVVASRRFGAASWSLGLYLVPLSLASAGLGLVGVAGDWSRPAAECGALGLLVLATPGGIAFALLFHHPWVWTRLRTNLVGGAALAAVVMVSWLLVDQEGNDATQRPVGYLGWFGMVVGVYLLAGAVLALTLLERTLKSVDDKDRWRIKFVVLGLVAPLAATIYVASQVLLHRSVPGVELDVLSATVVLGSSLLVVAWRRMQGGVGVVISHGLAYGSLTFLLVGVYLLVSSVVAHWAQEFFPTFPSEFLLLITSGIVLGAVLLSTSARQRARDWLRRNVFSGRYDYRAIWMEASERIRDSDPPDVAATALVELVRDALGEVEVAMWGRGDRDGNLQLLAMRGLRRDDMATTDLVQAVLERLVSSGETAVDVELLVTGGGDESREVARATKASLLVLLRSGSETVGLLSVGSDRTGRKFGWEAKEFLKVLAGHAARELHKRELLAAQVRAKEDEAFRAFSTFLLHDLKNYASTLSMVARNAVTYADDPQFRRDAFESIGETSEKMKRLINSLRTFSTTLAADRSPQDLNQVVRAVIGELDTGPAGRIVLDLHELPPVLIDGDGIGRVIQNLVINATEALTEPTSGAVRVRTALAGDAVELVVEDDGRGIPRKFLENALFLPFRTTKSSGLGIGLFHSKKIVDVHGGTIEVESSVGKGTKVRVRLPCKHDESVTGISTDGPTW